MATATKTKTTLKPLEDRVVILPNKAETKTASGIYLPEGAQEKPLMGKVVAAGPGKLTDDGNRAPLGVKKGDIVVYGQYAGSEVELDGVSHMICRESELLGVVEK
ncbi:MAG: co-chaperone GroES [Phycisphaeraceae bacterium]|nr:co-chaperone GroES [Phycisphaeraceae bacterium]